MTDRARIAKPIYDTRRVDPPTQQTVDATLPTTSPRLQYRFADIPARPSTHRRNVDGVVVQRIRLSDSNSFYGPQVSEFDLPVAYAQSILQAFHGRNIADDETAVGTVELRYSDTTRIKWVEITGSELKDLQRHVHQRSPEGRKEAAENARLRGDDNPDVNVSASNVNCGYCVIGAILGEEAGDVKRTMDARGVRANSDGSLDLTHIAAWLGAHGIGVSSIVQSGSKNELEAQLKALHAKTKCERFILRFPAHFVIVTINDTGSAAGGITISINDPQANETFDFEHLPETNFAFICAPFS